jgi:hypothetical protein
VRKARVDEAHCAHERELIRKVPAFERRGLECSRRRPARVDNQDVEAAELGDRGFDQRLRIAGLRHVSGLPSRRADRLACGFDRGRVAGRDEDLRTLGGQRLGAGSAETLAGGDDERTAPVEAKIHAHNCGVRRTIRVTATPHANGWTFQVSIEEDGRTVSEHAVEVSKSDVKRLAPESSVEELVLRSFEFLLEREPPSNILRRFALSDIERYFPEYPKTIGG